jgi:type I restriction enzyme, S subunit
MNNWSTYILGDLIKCNKKSISNNYRFNEILYLDTGSITEGKIQGFQNIALSNAPSRAKRLVENEDIIYSTVRPIQRHYGFITNPQPNLVVSTGFVTITCNMDIIYPKFLYYFLTNDETVNFLDVIAEGSTSAYPSLKPSDIENLDITLPPLTTQKAIAEVLSSLDDKIDLLHRQNKTLEQMAETLFRQRFVEEAGEDWEEKFLGDITDIKAGGDRPNIYSKIKTERCKVPIYSNGVDKEGLFGFTDTARIFDECITISARGTIGFVCLRHEPFVPIVRLISIVPNENFLSSKYLYFWAKSQIISGTGTTQEQLTVPDFSRTTIILPPYDKMKAFTNHINILFSQIKLNQAQIITLSTLRDTLLPKLMSGEVQLNI